MALISPNSPYPAAGRVYGKVINTLQPHVCTDLPPFIKLPMRATPPVAQPPTAQPSSLKANRRALHNRESIIDYAKRFPFVNSEIASREKFSRGGAPTYPQPASNPSQTRSAPKFGKTWPSVSLVELPPVDVFQPRRQIETRLASESEGHRGLAVAVHALPVQIHTRSISGI